MEEKKDSIRIKLAETDEELFVNGTEYRIEKLLGKGKGGYSYLASSAGNLNIFRILVWMIGINKFMVESSLVRWRKHEPQEQGNTRNRDLYGRHCKRL